MESRLTPLVIGGLIPAVLYGVAGVFQKWSAREGGSAPMYLIGFGLATVLSGLVFRAVLGESAAPPRSIVAALLGGGSFGVGAGLVSVALIRHDAALSQLAPLYNMNTLVAVLLGLLVFAEFRELQVMRLAAGTALIVLGGWLVSGA